MSSGQFNTNGTNFVSDVQLEMERALLEGEQQIQLEQLDAAREKVAALEAKESKLLDEAASERLKVCTGQSPIILYYL